MSEEKELISRKNRSPSSIIKEILVSQFQIGEKFTSNRISRISGLSSGKCSGFLHRLSKIGFLKVEEKIFVEESNMTCYNYEIIKDPARISVHKFSRVQGYLVKATSFPSSSKTNDHPSKSFKSSFFSSPMISRKMASPKRSSILRSRSLKLNVSAESSHDRRNRERRNNDQASSPVQDLFRYEVEFNSTNFRSPRFIPGWHSASGERSFYAW